MIVNFGKQEFVVDPEIDYIIRRSCYLDGKNCANCEANEECLIELDYVLENTKGQIEVC